MTAPASRAAGFTLVELLVAVTLFALLSVALFGGLRFGMRASETGTARLDWSAEIAAASGFLRNQLADAQPLQKDAADGNKVVAFDGERDSVEFVSSPPAHLAAGGWHVLRFALERRRDGDRLVLSWRLVRAGAGETAAGSEQRSVLLDRVTAIEFAYFGALTEGDTPEWHDHWRDAADLPALVRLRMSFADGRQAPELLVALRAAGPVWSAQSAR